MLLVILVALVGSIAVLKIAKSFRSAVFKRTAYLHCQSCGRVRFGTAHISNLEFLFECNTCMKWTDIV